MTRDEIQSKLNDIDTEIAKLRSRMNLRRNDRNKLILQAHGIELDKTVVRAMEGVRDKLFGKLFVVTAVEDERLSIHHKPYLHVTRYPFKPGAKSFPLGKHWDFATPQDFVEASL